MLHLLYWQTCKMTKVGLSHLYSTLFMRSSILSFAVLFALTACTSNTTVGQNSSSSSFSQSSPTSSVVLDDDVQLTQPHLNQTVTSPLIVNGSARGTWYFEASFPVQLIDADGNELAQKPAQAQSDWMTTDFVPFSVMLTFEEPATENGFLILKKDNPAGDPAKDAEVRVPVRFR